MTDKKGRDCTPVALGDEQLQGNQASLAPWQNLTTLDAKWFQQASKSYQVMQTASGPLLLQLQGTQLASAGAAPAAPGAIPPRMVYHPRGLLPVVGHQGAVPLGIFPPAPIQQPTAHLSQISHPHALPSSHLALDSIPPTQEAVPLHVNPPQHLLDHVQLQNHTAVKQEMPSTGSGEYYRNLLGAQIRMHLSELRKIQQLQYLLDHHAPQQGSLPEMATADISKEAQHPPDLASFKVSSSVLVTSADQTQISQDSILSTDTNLEISQNALVSFKSHQDQEIPPNIYSEGDITSSVIDLSSKKESSTCGSGFPHESTKSDGHVVPNRSPVLQQDNLVLSLKTALPHSGSPFLPPDTSPRHSHSLNSMQQPIMKPQPGLVTQGGIPHQPDLRKSPATQKKAVPEMHASFTEVSSEDESAPEHALPLVSEVGYSSQRTPGTTTKSNSGKLLQSLNSLLGEELVTMGSSSNLYNQPLNLTSVSNLHKVEDIPALYASLKTEPASTKTEPSAQEQSQVLESKGIITDVDFRKQPPADNKCPICTDKVSGYHYGMYSCESCKGFFKRTIHSKKNEKLKCLFGGECVVDLRGRKQCAACRFKKCLNLGMKLEAIRQDRQRGGRSLYEGSSEQRRLNRLKEEQETQSPASKKCKQKHLSTPGKISNTSTSPKGSKSSKLQTPVSTCKSQPGPSLWTVKVEPKLPGLPQLIQELMEQEKVFVQQSVQECCLKTLREEKNLLETLCHFVNHQILPLVKWAKGLPLYGKLLIEDQIRLLFRNTLSILCLNVIFYCLDHNGRLLLPENQVIDLTTFNAAKFHQLVPKITSIADQLHSAGLDMPGFVCLKLIMLLSPDAPNVQCGDQIQCYQDDVQELFFDHVARTQPGNSRAVGNLVLGMAAIERVAQQLNIETVWNFDVVERVFRHEEGVCSDLPCIQSRVQ